MSDLDDIDRRLLALLQANGRMSYAEMAKAVGLAVSSVNERVRKLTERGVISGVHVAVAPEALGLDLLAFVFVGWTDPATEAPFLVRARAEPAILECHHVTGAWNYLMKVRTHTTRDLEAFLGAIVKAVPGVQRTETIIVLSSAKETAQLPTTRPNWRG
jgi:Lrp/AsnC family leucine-responsive transcriptional regulator